MRLDRRALIVLMAAGLNMAGNAQCSTVLATSRTAGVITLGAGTTRIPLVATDSASLAARVREVGPDRRLYLKLLHLRSQGSPGVTYNVYFNLPPDQPPHGVGDPHYLGTISFFDAENGRDRTTALNVTERLKRLAAEGRLGGTASVTIAPAGTPDTSALPQIGEIVITLD